MEFSPVWFTALRLLGGALALAPFVWRRRDGAAPWSATLALLVYAFAFSYAYVTLDAGTGALLLFGTVQVTMLTAALRAAERPSPRRWAGLLLALVGVAVLVAPGVTAPDPLGAAAMVAAGVGWGGYTLAGRGASDPTVSNGVHFLRGLWIAAPLLALRAAGLLDSADPSAPFLDARGSLLALASGAVTSGIGYAIWYAALRGHSASSAAIVQLSVPVLAAAGGVAFLGEAVSTRLVGASLLTLGGVALALTSRRG